MGKCENWYLKSECFDSSTFESLRLPVDLLQLIWAEQRANLLIYVHTQYINENQKLVVIKRLPN